MNACSIKWKIIENGSYVLVKKDETSPSSHDPYLFIVNGAATLKKFKKEGEYVYLLPESNDDSHKPIILTQDDDVSSNGKVVDVFSF
jgi:repressor LexA